MKTKGVDGASCEKVAEDYYLRLGFQLIERNFRRRFGEIDLVMKKGESLLFVEVKGRSRLDPDEAWGPRWRRKKRKIALVARAFLAQPAWRDSQDLELKFEIVFVTRGIVSWRFEDEPLP